MSTTILVNDVSAIAARLSIPGTGAWLADVDIDLADAGVLPSGRVVLTIGTDTLVGTVDARASGRMGPKAHVQIVGGGGGWDRVVPALHFHNDFGVTSTNLFSATASAVGEVVVDDVPATLGADFVRSAGPASRVLSGREWYVDASGVTHVGARPIVAKGADVDVLEWDACTRRAVLASDGVVWPGTRLDDVRFGLATIRDIEQSFSETGARVLAWCDVGAASDALPGSRLARAIGALARESVGVTFLRLHPYRVAVPGTEGRYTLQRVGDGDVPRILESVSVYPGIAAVDVELAPGSGVLVAFLAGSPKKPIVVGFAPDCPAAEAITIHADRVNVGAGAVAVVRLTSTLQAWLEGVASFCSLPLPPGFASTKLYTD